MLVGIFGRIFLNVFNRIDLLFLFFFLLLSIIFVVVVVILKRYRPQTDVLLVDRVFSSAAVNFDILTDHNHQVQLVAYYDSDRYLTVAMRNLGEYRWRKKRLDTKIEWNSHNYVKIGIDDAGYIHVAGNMHTTPLIYFRSKKPLSVRTIEKIDFMTGEDEKKVTYPEFFLDSSGNLLFMYRSGVSGNGKTFINKFNSEKMIWSRLNQEPLFASDPSSKKTVNAYYDGPYQSQDGFHHYMYVWRSSSNAETNFNVNYVKTQDYQTWYNSQDEAMSLPLTPSNSEVVDEIPEKSGLININLKIGADYENQPFLIYQKYDENGFTQLFKASPRKKNDSQENSRKWSINQITDWKYRWDFSGKGSLQADIFLEEPYLKDSSYVIPFTHPQVTKQSLFIDLNTQQVAILENDFDSFDHPRVLSQDESLLNKVRDLADSKEDDKEYVIVWESMHQNRDLPFDKEVPPTELLLYIQHKKSVWADWSLMWDAIKKIVGSSKL